jgi:hypothetical protein
VYHMNNLLKFKTRLPQLRTLQNVSIIEGFDPARKWYLYDHIWQCCYSEEAKELTCPKPTAPKKEIYRANQEKRKRVQTKKGKEKGLSELKIDNNMCSSCLIFRQYNNYQCIYVCWLI